ncbi:ABC transporter substrate-binding protein [Nocardioides sp. OK12]|uniref:Phospholipid/cholesterol/gamma-HCH transport system substrate-binding protein n=1 Tax=Nocardioides marinisabuli TaxID=419476 RepID=A0A7Y9EYU2_9ACTN|nr:MULTISPECIES: MCE family protein [Nocardioides]NYD56492.1 phospholipid/cholesterol/gamma-HCH transport system substrate-binding protein [Nocardioides marinisabuli]GHJ59247.1 ABC transporter substrate-binding protein [Nocardioides sp. OK12]
MILRQFKLLGIVFLAMLVGGAWLTYAIFTKKFVDYDEVTLQSSRIGLQLPERADVKIRGVIVGEVLDYVPTEAGADITLGLYPDDIDTIPADVTGSIVPKTLFGEKYVALVVEGDDVGGPSIEAGAVIDRTEVATEVEKVLSDLNPLLRTVQPAELNMTLNALATALEGRGDQLGENLETLDSYLKRFNPQLPGAIEDLRLTAEVSDIYADVLPEVGQILRDQVTTLGTLEEQSDTLNALFRDVSAFSGSARTFLAENEQNLIRLGEVSEPQVRLLAKYSPQFTCLTRGIVNAGKLQAEAFRNFTLHIVLETLPNQPRGYNANDQPRYGEDRGPNCLNLPSPPGSQENPNQVQPDMDDGVDEPTGKGTSRVTPGPSFDAGQGYAGSLAESELLKSLLAPGMGVSASDVPDLGALLLGPMARGAEVSLR